MSADNRKKAAGFGVQFHCHSHNVKEWLGFYEVLDKLKSAKHSRLTNLQSEYTNSVEVLGISTKADPNELKYWKDFLQELLSIETALEIEFDLPDQIPGEQYNRALAISTSLNTGLMNVDSHAIVPEGAVLIVNKKSTEARSLVEVCSKNGSIDFFDEEAIDVNIELVGKELSLGAGRWEFPGCIILDVLDSDMIRIGLDSVSADAEVNLAIQIDRKQSRIRLLEWGEKPTDESDDASSEVTE
jgi:hypothetical protein